MSLQDVGLVLAKAALFDARFREPDVNIARAWDEALGDFDVRAALDAVAAHYRDETRTLMPADVVRRLREVRYSSVSLPAYRKASDVLADIEARVDAENPRPAVTRRVRPPSDEDRELLRQYRERLQERFDRGD